MDSYTSEGAGALKSRYVAGVLTFYRTDGTEIWSISPANGAVAFASGSAVTIAGALTQTGAVTFSGAGTFLNALFATASDAAPVIIGAGAAASALEVGGITGVATAFTVNWKNSAATITGSWAGINLSLEDAGAGAQNNIPIVNTFLKSAGVGTGVGYGYFGNATFAGGFQENVVGIRQKVQVKNTTAFEVGTAGGSPNVCSAIYATMDVDTDCTYTDVFIAAIHGGLIGNSVNSAVKQKATAIFLAEMGGDSAANSAGAFFKAIRTNSFSDPAGTCDYGLDLYSAEAGYSVNRFAVGDLRLGGSVGPVIMQGTSDPNGSLTRPKGSLHLDTTNATLKINTDAGTTWAATG